MSEQAFNRSISLSYSLLTIGKAPAKEITLVAVGCLVDFDDFKSSGFDSTFAPGGERFPCIARTGRGCYLQEQRMNLGRECFYFVLLAARSELGGS